MHSHSESPPEHFLRQQDFFKNGLCREQAAYFFERYVDRRERDIKPRAHEHHGNASAGNANADIMISIIERIRERVQKGARTFMVKVKAHRGEPLNEKADTQAENARQLQDDCRQWTVRTPSMTYEWSDSNGV